jgi:hypothetical protein
MVLLEIRLFFLTFKTHLYFTRAIIRAKLKLFEQILLWWTQASRLVFIECLRNFTLKQFSRCSMTFILNIYRKHFRFDLIFCINLFLILRLVPEFYFAEILKINLNFFLGSTLLWWWIFGITWIVPQYFDFIQLFYCAFLSVLLFQY